jgi:hypothetical protein
MTTEISWSDPVEVHCIAATGALKNLAAAAVAAGAAYDNRTAKKRLADFVLYIHDFAAAPAAGGYFELHLIYKPDGTNYADGEDGDVASPHLSANTFEQVFNIYAGDEDQRIMVKEVPILPHAFVPVVKNSTSQAVANSDGSTLDMYVYGEQV